MKEGARGSEGKGDVSHLCLGTIGWLQENTWDIGDTLSPLLAPYGPYFRFSSFPSTWLPPNY